MTGLILKCKYQFSDTPRIKNEILKLTREYAIVDIKAYGNYEVNENKCISFEDHLFLEYGKIKQNETNIREMINVCFNCTNAVMRVMGHLKKDQQKDFIFCEIVFNKGNWNCSSENEVLRLLKKSTVVDLKNERIEVLEFE